MKIAIVGLYPEDRSKIRGGVEAVTLRLCDGLARIEGNDVHVVVCEAGRPVGTRHAGDRLTIHTVAASKRFGNAVMALPDRRAIARKLAEIGPQIVHAHNADRFALGALDSGFPTVVTIHGVMDAEENLERGAVKRLRGSLRNRIHATALRRMEHVIALSPYVLAHYGDRLSHVHGEVIENPVGDEFFELTGDAAPATFLHSGLLIPRKGICNLLEALAVACEDVPEMRIRFAGQATDDEYKKKIDRTVNDLGLEGHVDFLGGLTPEALIGELGRASALLLVSKQETLPVAILEAMAARRPVIASPAGGVPDVVQDGSTGFLVPHGRPRELAEKMTLLALDADLRRTMGAAARGVAEKRFRIGAVCAKTMDYYRRILELQKK